MTYFLAPTGAQGVTMSVRSSVRSFGSNLSRALNLHLSTSDLQANFMSTSGSQLAVSQQSTVSQSVSQQSVSQSVVSQSVESVSIWSAVSQSAVI